MLRAEFEIQEVTHFLPLHYLPYIARSRELLSKPALRAAGFDHCHFRSKSRNSDLGRGFGEFAFLTLDKQARIVCAKLKAGFPHVALAVPSVWLEQREYLLCRYNVAMTRKLRRNGKKGFPESLSNGRYIGGMQIPVAESDEEKRAMLERHYRNGIMIEVLVRDRLPLPLDCSVIAYDRNDQHLVDRVLEAVGSVWTSRLAPPPGEYKRAKKHANSVTAFIERALAEEDWKGNCLEFDSFRG